MAYTCVAICSLLNAALSYGYAAIQPFGGIGYVSQPIAMCANATTLIGNHIQVEYCIIYLCKSKF